jgi:hypothetical protein
MAVELSNDRKAVEITWDSSLVNGKKVEIRCVNPENQDISTRKTENDGKAVITFPADYSGMCHVTVVGAGDTEDSGTIFV